VDACGLTPEGRAAAVDGAPEIGSGLPADGYGRGAAAPIQPTQPSLFFRAGVENLCEAVATRVIDPAPGSGFARWTSADPETAISDFVAQLLALTPSDPRAAAARSLLEAHFRAALDQSGISATDALRSTFVISCLSPGMVSIGL
jgi:hypothetical protein